MAFNYEDIFFLEILTCICRFLSAGCKKTARLCVVVLQPGCIEFLEAFYLTRRDRPARIVALREIPFSEQRRLTVVPKREAILLKVSPRRIL